MDSDDQVAVALDVPEAGYDLRVKYTELPARRRDAFLHALGRLLPDEQSAAEILWQELVFLDEAEAGSALCYAHLTLAAAANVDPADKIESESRLRSAPVYRAGSTC